MGGKCCGSDHYRELSRENRFGIDHSRFTHKFQGLDYKLTGVEPAKVVKDILA